MKSTIFALISTIASATAELHAANAIKIISPAPNDTISGIYRFSADISAAPTVDRVEYRLASFRVGIATASPFQVSWNTGYAADGNYSLEALAYDATGALIATANQVFNIQNRGCSLTLDKDLTEVLHGKLNLSITASDPLYYPARWAVFLDGILQILELSDGTGQNKFTESLPIDTTRISNGRHELHVEVGSNFWNGAPTNKTWYSARLALHRVITIDNGRLLVAITANFLHVFLKPGESSALNCRAWNADRSSGGCVSPSYNSSDPKVVSVNPSGMLRAHDAEGFSKISIASGDLKTEAYVWVRRNLNIPHLAGNGTFLTSYKPGLSIFPISPFRLDIADLQNEALNRETKRAGVNTLNLGFYSNPRDLKTNIDQWISSYDSQVAPQWTWAARNGYHLYLTGDEIARNIGQEGWWTLNWPFGKQAVQHAMESVASSGVGLAADIIDEGSMLWGGTPTPPRHVGEAGMFTSIKCQGYTCAVTWPDNPVRPGRFYAGIQFALTGSKQPNLNTPPGQMFTATHISNSGFEFAPAGPVDGVFSEATDRDLEFLWWAGSATGCPNSPCNPPVPNTALETIAGWLRTASPHVPISWPALGLHPPAVHDAWAGRDSKVSDFFSHYWDTLQSGHTYRWSCGIAERIYWMRDAFYSRQPYVNNTRPQLLLDSISSYYYFKRAPGNQFDPLRDDLWNAPASPATVTAGMMTASALGGAGIRLYQYDNISNFGARERLPVSNEAQSGASPISPEDYSRRLWRAMAYAANLLTKTLEPFLLGTGLSSPALGENIVTAARRSERGVLVMAVNGNDWDRRIAVNLGSFHNGNPITRYLVQATGIETAVISDAVSDTIDLSSGATVIYLIPSSREVQFLTTVRIPAPTLPAGASTAFLHHAYIYGDDLDAANEGLECTNGCSVGIDREVGDSYYQFSFTNADGAAIQKGPEQLLKGLR
jgi:hypothetical protein